MSQQLPAPAMKIVLGHRLKHLRQVAGLNQDEAAAILECSPRKLESAESGGGIKTDQLDVLLSHYGASDIDSAYARQLHQECSHRPKRDELCTRFGQYPRLQADIELSCRRLSCYRAMTIPELLQTEDCMRTLLRAWRPSPTAAKVDQAVERLLARQSVLDNLEQGFWFIIDEAALHKTIGDAPIKKKQLLRLVELSDQPNIELQVVPFDAGFYMGQGYDYTIFGYDTELGADIVYGEHDGSDYVYDAALTQMYKSAWDQQISVGHGPRKTRRVLTEFAEAL